MTLAQQRRAELATWIGLESPTEPLQNALAGAGRDDTWI